MRKTRRARSSEAPGSASVREVTLALGLRSAAQSLGVIGRELGAFASQGLDLRVVRMETAGPEGAHGLAAGEYQFAEFGAVPVVQAALEGKDLLMILAAEPVSALYVLGRRDIADVGSLRGGALGVLSESGQTGYSAKRMLEQWGLAHAVRLVPLGTYPAIFDALASRELESGVLTADYKIAGELRYGFRELADLGREFQYQGPVLATTRRLRDSDPALLAKMVASYREAIRLFKHEAERVVPVLRRHLGFVDDAQAAAIQRFYAARFQATPLVSREGIARVIRSFAKQYPAALKLEPNDVYDASFVEGAVEQQST